ncbi:hypothetical protein ABPG75_001044 [Micractinium tetrahymenae]
MDAASAHGNKGLNYGINWASHVPEEARHADRSDFAEAIRRRLEEAAKRKEEEREKAAQRYQRKEHRVGRLTGGQGLGGLFLWERLHVKATYICSCAVVANAHCCPVLPSGCVLPSCNRQTVGMRVGMPPVLAVSRLLFVCNRGEAEDSWRFWWQPQPLTVSRIIYPCVRVCAEEEMQRRLAEMMGAAQEHEEERAQRLRRQAEREAAEEEQGGRHHTDTAAFLQAATKDVYGTTQGGSLEDTVGRRAFFNERRECGGSAFRKHG